MAKVASKNGKVERHRAKYRERKDECKKEKEKERIL